MGTGVQTAATNRKARFDYHLGETFEAGLVLKGSEVKSIRQGRVDLKDSYVRIENGEAFLVGAHIHTYPFAHQFNHDPERNRKLLPHKRQIMRLFGKVREKGVTLVPLRLYFKRGRVKLEFAVARGKKVRDRREDIKARDAARDVHHALRERHRGAGQR